MTPNEKDLIDESYRDYIKAMFATLVANATTNPATALERYHSGVKLSRTMRDKAKELE